MMSFWEKNWRSATVNGASKIAKGLFVLGGCADISRDAAEKLLRPLELMKVGSRIGAAAASEAKRMGGQD